jgi:hypothetical protein
MLGVFPFNEISGVGQATRTSGGSPNFGNLRAPNPSNLSTPSDLSVADPAMFPRPLTIHRAPSPSNLRAPNPSNLSTPSDLSIADPGMFPRSINYASRNEASISYRDVSTVYPSSLDRVYYPNSQFNRVPTSNVGYSDNQVSEYYRVSGNVPYFPGQAIEQNQVSGGSQLINYPAVQGEVSDVNTSIN